MTKEARVRILGACLALFACGCDDLKDVEGTLDLHDWIIDMAVPDMATPPPPGDMAAPPPGAIDGVVIDFLGGDQAVVPGATIAVAGVGSVISDANGRFLLGGIPASSSVTVTVSVPDNPAGATYSSLTLVTQVAAGETTHLAPRLLLACTQVVAINAGVAGSVDVVSSCGRPSSYAQISWEGDGLAEAGTVFAGNAVFALMPVPFPRTSPIDLSWFVTVPGDGSGVTASGTPTLLDGFGAAEFRIFDATTGAPITAASGHQLTITLEMFAPAPSGETPSAWRFDSTGKWVEQGPGEFDGMDGDGGVPDAGVPGFDVFRFQTTQLGWWASAAAVSGSTRGCVRGRLSSSGSDGGVPASGVAVIASAQGQGSVSSAVTGADGKFCLDAPGGATVNVSALEISSGATMFRVAGSGTVGAAGHACGDTIDACPDIGDFELGSMPPVCVLGRTRKQGCTVGAPNAPVTEPLPLFTDIVVPQTSLDVGVFSHVYLGVVTPGSDGRFCAELSAGGTYYLEDPATGGQHQFIVPASSNAGSCGVDQASCNDLGEIDFFCGY
jgi:hypothetical protein